MARYTEVKLWRYNSVSSAKQWHAMLWLELGGSAFDGLLVFCLLLGVFWCWYDNMRARETASAHAHDFCQQQQYQFLDGSVCLRVVGFNFARRRLRRHYDFYYTRDSRDRQRGTVILIGHEIEHFLLDEDTIEM